MFCKGLLFIKTPFLGSFTYVFCFHGAFAGSENGEFPDLNVSVESNLSGAPRIRPLRPSLLPAPEETLDPSTPEDDPWKSACSTKPAEKYICFNKILHYMHTKVPIWGRWTLTDNNDQMQFRVCLIKHVFTFAFVQYKYAPYSAFWSSHVVFKFWRQFHKQSLVCRFLKSSQNRSF